MTTYTNYTFNQYTKIKELITDELSEYKKQNRFIFRDKPHNEDFAPQSFFRMKILSDDPLTPHVKSGYATQNTYELNFYWKSSPEFEYIQITDIYEHIRTLLDDNRCIDTYWYDLQTSTIFDGLNFPTPIEDEEFDDNDWGGFLMTITLKMNKF